MPLKKSLFNKPAWAAKTSTSMQDDKAIFEQNIYEDILEAKRKREEKKLVRQKEKAEQRRKSSSRDTKVDEDEQPVKKRRISDNALEPSLHEEESDTWKSVSESDSDKSAQGVQKRNKRSSSPRQSSEPVLRSTPQKDVNLNSETEDNRQKVTEKRKAMLDDDDELVLLEVLPKSHPQPSKAKTKAAPPPESDSDPDDDEYMKALKRTARVEARTKKLHANHRQATPQTDARSPSSIYSGSSNAKLELIDRVTPTPAIVDNNSDDPEISILIKTIIPKCADVFVKRRASQPLDVVFDWFVKHYELSPVVASKVFFTWNGTKLYKSTTMRSILATIKNKYGTRKDGGDLAEGKIEIEAVTEEIFQHRLKQKERQRKIAENGGELPADEQESSIRETDVQADNAAQQGDQQPQRPNGTVIHLTSDGDEALPDMNLRVHPHTTIERIVNGYRKKMRIDVNKHIYLIFDGDKLENQQTVADIGFEDGDKVELRSK